MNRRIGLLAGILAGAAGLAFGQNSTYEQKTTTTTQTTSTSGSVVRYEPGHTLVLREGNRTVTYTLSPDVVIPADVEVGRTVTVTTDPANEKTVTKIVTTDTDEMGRPRRTTETREVDSRGNMTTTKTTRVFGTIESYEAGKSVTIVKPNGDRVTYLITNQSRLPGDVTVGKKVTILTTPGAGASEPVVKTITITTESPNPPER